MLSVSQDSTRSATQFILSRVLYRKQAQHHILFTVILHRHSEYTMTVTLCIVYIVLNTSNLLSIYLLSMRTDPFISTLFSDSIIENLPERQTQLQYLCGKK